ncbi:MAG TPA: IS110 family transposase [Daejeonella sp.]|jgi:transposase|uniref:IS110 family transposase n=1 Tax=Daejeonella sp. TaxID=2805397 RepID=UPI002CD307B6|nr:IS110 family transposase [Daejeonella sp.]HQS52831.1 IS110 family transposase [Daejeonella sp.]HQT59557.1 IS110 family transposase [Daejeonella sp.]
MEKIRNHAAGIDIGARQVFVSVEGEPVCSFETFTSDLMALSNYLADQKVETVAMEATGVYWFVLYDILRQAGLDVWLVDGRQTRQVPGRKTDVKDCQWIQQLHSYGLLNRCYVSEGLLKELRSYQRIREDHLRSASMHIQHMQKALIGMNIRLPEVLSQIHGKSGIAMIQAILEGERDKEKLLSLCHYTLREKKREQLIKALEGHYTEAGLFALSQGYQAYVFYQGQIQACDKKMEETLARINQDKDMPEGFEVGTRKPIRHNKPQVENLDKHLLKIFGGRDATRLPGFTDYNWLQLYSELGSDLSNWPSEKHFTSWLGLSPGQNNSGSQKRTRAKGKPLVGQIFKEIAHGLLNSKYIGWGAFGRRIKGRKGAPIAIKATARKLAVQYWRLMVKGSNFVERGIEAYEKQLIAQKQKQLNRLAMELNMVVTTG